jgi:thiol-disulfide isomerase/thioredoxin
MSNTTYRGTQVPTRSKARPKVEAASIIDDAADVDDDAYVEVDDFEEQPTGLFSTPARTVTLIASLALLVVLLATVVWVVSSRGSTSGNSGVASNDGTTVSVPYDGSEIQVSTITKANLGGEGEAPATGSRVPDFEWNDLVSGKPMRLSTLGKPALVNFWGTWCPPCKAEMPEMQRLYTQYKDQVEFVGISMGPRDSTSVVKSFVNHPPAERPNTPLAYTWRFVHDGNYDVATRYQVSAVPSSFFVGRDGVIKAVHIGGMSAQQIESYLQQVK